MRRILTLAPLLVALVVLALPVAAQASVQRYVVVLRAGADPAAAAHRHGAAADHLYSHALRGYAAALSGQALARAQADPAVLYVAVDRVVSIAAKGAPPPPPPPPQVTPTGILRIGNAASRADGVDDAVNVDVAIIDTGIDTKHADLRVAGGKNCSSGTTYVDGNGHGSHVAGTVGAKDNTIGVVGVAPGARLWAVRVLNNAGSGSISSVICGIDWVTVNAATIEVANLSLGGPGSDDRNCGATNNDPMHAAICRSVAAGVTYVVAAGNSKADAALSTPAAYDEVITVSAFADFDGIAGGLGSPTCRIDVDDTFADFSNYGADVDIAAPGVCIKSTWKGGGYDTISGTSMASPHVAGAAALYKSLNPLVSPAAVKAALTSHANLTPVPDDPDTTWEGLLSLGGWL